MSKYIVEYEDTPLEEEREDGVDYYKCLNAPYRFESETFIKKLTPYDETEAFDDGLEQMYEAICTVFTMPEREIKKRFGETFAHNVLNKNTYGEFFNRYLTYKKDMDIPQVGDVVEYHDRRYLLVSIDEELYYLLNGSSFEVVCVDKSLKNEIIKTSYHKDLDRLSKALKGET